jgi:hypothetical protein
MVYLIAFAFWCGPSQASEFLNRRQEGILQQHVREYFSPESGGDATQLDAIRPHFAILQIVLRATRVQLETSPEDPVALQRATQLLALLARKSRLLTVPLGADLREALYQDLAWFLRRISDIHAVEPVLEMYDRWRMWTSKELWFFLRFKDSWMMRVNAARIRSIMPRLNPIEREDLAEGLRRMIPKDIFQNVLLLKTGRMKESELVQLLGLLSRQFARALDRRSDSGDDRYLIYSLEDPVQRAINSTIHDLMHLLKERDAMVGSAFDRAVANARLATGRNYNPESRLLFFKLLQEGRLDWADKTTWIPAADKISKENVSLKQRYRVDGSVILVQFRPKPDCEGKLENR